MKHCLQSAQKKTLLTFFLFDENGKYKSIALEKKSEKILLIFPNNGSYTY